MERWVGKFHGRSYCSKKETTLHLRPRLGFEATVSDHLNMSREDDGVYLGPSQGEKTSDYPFYGTFISDVFKVYIQSYYDMADVRCCSVGGRYSCLLVAPPRRNSTKHMVAAYPTAVETTKRFPFHESARNRTRYVRATNKTGA